MPKAYFGPVAAGHGFEARARPAFGAAASFAVGLAAQDRAVALNYPPKVGEIFECTFPICLAEPEMVKTRLVIIVGPRLPGRDSRLVNVVPISMSLAPAGCACHVEIPASAIPLPWQSVCGKRWAKCDMIYALSTDRLMLALGARNRSAAGRRLSYKGRLDLDTLKAVRRCAARSLGIDGGLW